MGPYCTFCANRCFVPLPMATPPEALKAYGTATIIATCPAGQQFEKARVGWCYDDIQAAIAEQEAHTLAFEDLLEACMRVAEYECECPAYDDEGEAIECYICQCRRAVAKAKGKSEARDV